MNSFFSAKRSERFRTYYRAGLRIIVQPYGNFHTNYHAESISSIINLKTYREGTERQVKTADGHATVPPFKLCKLPRLGRAFGAVR